MTKSYPELLGEWIKRRDSTKRDQNLVAFLAVQDDVKDAIDAGYSVMTIWTHMHEEKRVFLGYEMFRAYVNRHIRPAQKRGIVKAVARDAARQLARTQQPRAKGLPVDVRPEVTAPDAVRGFTYNPTPKKEDLI